MLESASSRRGREKERPVLAERRHRLAVCWSPCRAEDEITRRRAPARAFGREETSLPDDAHRREHSEEAQCGERAGRVWRGAIRKRHHDNLTRTRQATESPPDQDKPPSRPPNQTIRLPPQDSDFGRHNAPTEAASAHATRARAQRANRRTKRSDYRLRNQILEGITHGRTAGSIRTEKTRVPNDAQWREHSEEEDTRRRAVAQAFGRRGYPTTRSGANLRKTRLPDDARTGAGIWTRQWELGHQSHQQDIKESTHATRTAGFGAHWGR